MTHVPPSRVVAEYRVRVQHDETPARQRPPWLRVLLVAVVVVVGAGHLLAVTLAAFAVLFRDAQILLFFVLPVPARWLLPIELLGAFIAFLATKDLAGLLGMYAAIGVVWLLLRHGGLGRGSRELWLRLQHLLARRRLARLRRRRGFHVVGEERRDPWLH